MHIACPSCGAVNRVPEQRLAEQPVCGKCGAALLAAQPFALDDRTLEHYLAHTELPVLVDFWAEWCGPCRMMAPQFAAAATQMPGVRFAKVDSDASPLASSRYAIRSIPTLILFRGGRQAARMSGTQSAGDLVAWVRSHLPSGAEAGAKS